MILAIVLDIQIKIDERHHKFPYKRRYENNKIFVTFWFKQYLLETENGNWPSDVAGINQLNN